MKKQAEGLMSLPQETILAILRREKESAFPIGNPCPFEVVLQRLIKSLKISADDFSKIVGVQPAEVDKFLKASKNSNKPSGLLRSQPDAIKKICRAIGFSKYDWDLAPSMAQYYNDPVTSITENYRPRRPSDEVARGKFADSLRKEIKKRRKK